MYLKFILAYKGNLTLSFRLVGEIHDLILFGKLINRHFLLDILRHDLSNLLGHFEFNCGILVMQTELDRTPTSLVLLFFSVDHLQIHKRLLWRVRRGKQLVLFRLVV